MHSTSAFVLARYERQIKLLCISNAYYIIAYRGTLLRN